MALRWGLIGCGDIVRKRVAAALRDSPGSELVSVSRGDASRLEACQQEVGAAKSFSDWREQIADADIDAVYIATPVSQHAEQTIAAAEAGKHVLCEKPMALHTASCDRMIKACRQNGVRLGVAYYRRFYPVLNRIRALLAAGTIGSVVLTEIRAFERFNPQPGEPRAWFLDPAQAGGGPLMDFGSHRLEVFRNLLGRFEVADSEIENLAFDRAVEDTALLRLRFDSGARGLLLVSHAPIEPQDTLDLYGTEGSLHVNVLNGGDLRVVTAEGERRESHPPHANLHLPLVQDFVEAVEAGREPTVNGAVGRDVQRLLEQAYRP
jgi:predicted dehydrogenase